MQLLYQTVQNVLATGRIGAPVFVRYVAQVASDRAKLQEEVAQTLAMVNAWLDSAPQRVYVQGGKDSGQLTATVQYPQGQTALLSVGVASPVRVGDIPLHPAPKIDLMLLGNKGALYHDSTSLSLLALAAAGSSATTIPLPISAPLMRAIEQSLRTNKSVTVEEVS